jgi:hypothetical protein
MTILCQFTFAVAAALPVAAFAPAQVTGITVSSFGQPCQPLFGGPNLQVTLDVQNQQLLVVVAAQYGCCNTYLSGRVLCLGLAQAAITLPPLPQCRLLVSPDIVLFRPNSAGDTFALPVGAVPPPLSLYAQGAAVYFTTIGFSTDVALSAGAQIDLW